MKALNSNNAPYFGGYAVLLLIMAGALVCVPKAELHLALNAYHTPWLDALMKGITYLAQWPIYALMLCFIVRRYSVVAYYLVSELAATAVVQILKAALNMPRPLEYFSHFASPDAFADFERIIVEGVNMHHWHSFPSGHTQTFFVCTTVLVLLLSSGILPMHPKATDEKSISESAKQSPVSPRGEKVARSAGSGALLLLATLGGLSRIYLNQHFLMDVCAGSLIGIAVPLLLWPLWQRFENKWPNRGLCYQYFNRKS